MRIKDDKKRLAIRDATVTEVVQSGLGSVSIGRIAARAGVSAGTIYLYYVNKEELLQEVYLEIKEAFHHRVMLLVEPQNSSAQNLRNMWFSLYDHLVQRPDDFVFSEHIGAARLLDSAHQTKIEGLSVDMVTVLQVAVSDGTLRNLPLSALRALMIAPATHLARQAATMGRALPKHVVEQTFDAVWRSVAQ